MHEQPAAATSEIEPGTADETPARGRSPWPVVIGALVWWGALVALRPGLTSGLVMPVVIALAAAWLAARRFGYVGRRDPDTAKAMRSKRIRAWQLRAAWRPTHVPPALGIAAGLALLAIGGAIGWLLGEPDARAIAWWALALPPVICAWAFTLDALLYQPATAVIIAGGLAAYGGVVRHAWVTVGVVAAVLIGGLWFADVLRAAWRAPLVDR